VYKFDKNDIVKDYTKIVEKLCFSYCENALERVILEADL
jgi:hypothetical protein